MEKIKNKLIRFMYGRSGPDNLFRATFGVYLVLAIANLFIHSLVINIILWAIFVWAMFRCFSKNVYKRQRENIKYLQLTDKIRKKFNMTKTMLTDKEHSYKKCPHCKKVLRLPKKTGTHSVKCPQCHETFSVKIR